MTKKDRIKESDLENVAGGQQSSSPKGTSFGDDAVTPPVENKSGRQSLTPEQAAAVSGGRGSQSPSQTPSLESDDPPSIRFSPDQPSPSDG